MLMPHCYRSQLAVLQVDTWLSHHHHQQQQQEVEAEANDGGTQNSCEANLKNKPNSKSHSSFNLQNIPGTHVLHTAGMPHAMLHTASTPCVHATPCAHSQMLAARLHAYIHTCTRFHTAANTDSVTTAAEPQHNKLRHSTLNPGSVCNVY